MPLWRAPFPFFLFYSSIRGFSDSSGVMIFKGHCAFLLSIVLIYASEEFVQKSFLVLANREPKKIMANIIDQCFQYYIRWAFLWLESYLVEPLQESQRDSMRFCSIQGRDIMIRFVLLLTKNYLFNACLNLLNSLIEPWERLFYQTHASCSRSW